MTVEIWSDIHQNWEADVQGNLRRSVNVESVLTSIVNILQTSPGERVMLPNFGSRAKAMVFERASQSEMEAYLDMLRADIERWETRAKIAAITVQVYPDKHEAHLQIQVQILGYQNVFQLPVNLIGL